MKFHIESADMKGISKDEEATVEFYPGTYYAFFCRV